MKKLQHFVLALMASAVINGQAASQENRVDNISPRQFTNAEDAFFAQNIKAKKLVKPEKSAIQHDGDVAYMVVVADGPGDLAEMVNNDFCEIDSLVVAGNIGGEQDFYALWHISFFDKLSAINLKHTTIVNGEIPDGAFFVYTEQFNWMEGEYKSIKLRHIILPDNVTKIGDFAFDHAKNLKEINFPASLESIGDYAFNECVKLNVDPSALPEGLETIGCNAFSNCYGLSKSLSIPSTVKEIGASAFQQCVIHDLTLSEGVEKIGNRAFFACNLGEVTVPSSCQELGEEVFRYNQILKKATLPEGIESIPQGTFYYCWLLTDFTMPSTVKSIGNKAFYHCGLKSLTLPDGVETIGDQAFYGISAVEEVSLPATLKSLGIESCCDWQSIKRIYCAATEPPVCKPNDSGFSPFGDKNNTHYYRRTPQTTPVYVPIGTAEKYRNAAGWDYFTTFIETDQFPTHASVSEIMTDPSEETGQTVYDLTGRRVEHPVKGQIYIKAGRKFICSE